MKSGGLLHHPSCDLFTLYVDDLPTTVAALGEAATSPKLGGVEIDTLLHADDLALVSTSAEGLQAQLNALAVYSDMWRLTVSISKTKVMVLSQGSMRSSTLSVQYKGQELEQVEVFTYLGVRLTSGGDMDEQAAGARLRAGRAAWAAVRGKAAQLGITSVKILCAFFDAVVRPALEYGVELWGPAYSACNTSGVTKGFFWENLSPGGSGGSRCRRLEGELVFTTYLSSLYVTIMQLLQLVFRIHENEGELASLDFGKLPERSIIKACKS